MCSKLLELSSAHIFDYNGFDFGFQFMVLGLFLLFGCGVFYSTLDSFLLGFVFIGMFWGGGMDRNNLRTIWENGKDISLP